MGERIKPVGTVELCIDAGFHCVFCQVRATNEASIRVCEKVGMALEGRMRGRTTRI